MEPCTGRSGTVATNLRWAVSNALVGCGYRRKGRQHVLRDSDQFSLWVDTGPLERRVDIAPFVGIRHHGIERLRAELLGRPQDDWVGTVGANVGYVLGGEYASWEPPSQADEVIRTIDLALERMRSFLSLDCLPAAWQIRGTKAPGWRYKRIVLFLLLGDSGALRTEIEAARGEYCVQNDEMCAEFLAFEQAVKSRLPG